jgi:hypothetical protein
MAVGTLLTDALGSLDEHVMRQDGQIMWLKVLLRVFGPAFGSNVALILITQH